VCVSRSQRVFKVALLRAPALLLWDINTMCFSWWDACRCNASGVMLPVWCSWCDACRGETWGPLRQAAATTPLSACSAARMSLLWVCPLASSVCSPLWRPRWVCPLASSGGCVHWHWAVGVSIGMERVFSIMEAKVGGHPLKWRLQGAASFQAACQRSAPGVWSPSWRPGRASGWAYFRMREHVSCPVKVSATFCQWVGSFDLELMWEALLEGGLSTK